MTGGAADLIDPRPKDVQRAMERVVTRWRQMPLAHAERCCDQVRGLAQYFADIASGPGGVAAIPALGPTAVIDQLRVTVYDVCAATHAEGRAEDLRQLLGALR